MGDLNSRISNIQPVNDCLTATKYTSDCNNNIFFLRNEAVHSRKSEDNTINAFGKTLIEMCASFGLIVLNGLCQGDVDGALTFISPNGSSVIDYCIASEDFFATNPKLSILPRIESWHMPVSLVFNTRRQTIADPSTIQPAVRSFKKIKWHIDKIPQFNYEWSLNNQRSNIANLTNVLLNNADLAEDCLATYTDLIVNSSHMMNKSIIINSKKKLRDTWFDKECLVQKRNVRKKLRKYRLTRSQGDKLVFTSKRKEYKELLKAKRNQYSL